MSLPAYSLENVHELAEGDKEFVATLVEAFLEEVPEDLNNMAQAVINNDSKAAYQYAHKMKPNFKLFNIDVVDQVKIIESWSQGNLPKSDADPALNHIIAVAKVAIDALKQDFA